MSCNVLRPFVGVGGGGGVGAVDIGRGGGGVVQNRASPDYRSPEVGRYVLVSDHLPQATPIQTPKFSRYSCNLSSTTTSCKQTL